MDLENRVAIVTGGAMGNGLGIAKVFLSKGAKIAIFDMSETLDDVVKDLCDQGYEVIGFRVNITDKEAVNKAVEATVKHFGKIDILVNNAGVMDALGILDASDENLDFHINVNVKGPWNVTKAVAPYMVERKYGRIVTLSSVTGTFVSDGDDTAYAVTKAALAGFGRSIAMLFIKDGITSNVMCPGFIHTPMVDKYAMECNPNDPESVLDSIGKSLPIGHLGTPEDVGYLAAYLASEHAGFITGAVIPIDGGCILPETNMDYIVEE